MSVFYKRINRRTFIKSSCAAGALAIAPVTYNALSQTCCKHCQCNISDPLMVSASGHCRNCGADVYTGVLDLPVCLFPEQESKRSQTFSKFAELPFPNPDIQHLTQKPCASAAELQAGISKIRKQANTVRA